MNDRLEIASRLFAAQLSAVPPTETTRIDWDTFQNFLKMADALIAAEWEMRPAFENPNSGSAPSNSSSSTPKIGEQAPEEVCFCGFDRDSHIRRRESPFAESTPFNPRPCPEFVSPTEGSGATRKSSAATNHCPICGQHPAKGVEE